jgi:hypothetical protein
MYGVSGQARSVGLWRRKLRLVVVSCGGAGKVCFGKAGSGMLGLGRHGLVYLTFGGRNVTHQASQRIGAATGREGT